MPKLWTETIEAHRHAVGDAILDETAALVGERGVRAVRMSHIAERVGIGRATLYKYFPDVDAILLAWHERQIAGHLEQLATIRDRTPDVDQRLEAVLEAYALIHHGLAGHRHGGYLEHGSELAAVLHRGEHVARAEQHLHHFMRELLDEVAASGAVRDDIAADELAVYCIHTLTAAARLPTKAAVRRLVTLTLAALRPAT